MLVIAPLRVCQGVWGQEATKWDEFHNLRVHVLHGPNKEQLLLSPHDVSVVNPEGLPWLFSMIAKHKLAWWEMLVVDESTRFKRTTTQRFKLLKPVLNFFKRRYILTGTPAPNGLIDLFGQVLILDMGRALGRYVTHYRMQFFRESGYGGYTWVLQDGAEEKIYTALKPLVLRMSGEDYLKLPPLITNTVRVQLPPKAMRQYAQMEAAMLIEVEQELVTAANAAAAANKCRQIANGGIYTNEAHDYAHIHEAKLDAVEDIVEELSGKPVLIAYEYKHDLERLQQRFAGAPFIGGGVTASAFADIAERWNAGELPILLAQPSSVAHGLNLQGVGAAVVWHSLTWDLEVYEQFNRRVWRQGQHQRVVVHHIVAEGTVDELIIRTLAKKDKTQKSLLGALKDYAQTKRQKRRVA